jgi:alpha-beta hydrolase superfamily lysophospholipase
LITLQALCAEDAPRVQSAVFSNPALGIAQEVPKIKEMASLWLKQFWPTLTLANEVRYHTLSRDPEKVSSYGKDPLRHNKISAPLYLGMLEAMEEVKESAYNIKVPIFFQISGQDQLVSPQASLDFYKTLDGEKSLKIYEQSYHEVYNDINKQEAIDDLIEYLAKWSS